MVISPAYLLQNYDQRIVFILPYHEHTLIGTTEVKLTTLPEKVDITPDEISYLLNVIRTYFNQTIHTQDILLSWSGIRPLIEHHDETPQALSRDYVLHYSKKPAASLQIYGGKITTYRQLACDAINKLKDIFPHLSTSTTDKIPLPGSQFPNGINLTMYRSLLNQHYPWLHSNIKNRLLDCYGTRLELILAHCNNVNDLGTHFGHGLYQAEVDYLIHHEWAQDVDDILWRRTKLGFHLNGEEKNKLSTYLRQSLSINV